MNVGAAEQDLWVTCLLNKSNQIGQREAAFLFCLLNQTHFSIRCLSSTSQIYSLLEGLRKRPSQSAVLVGAAAGGELWARHSCMGWATVSNSQHQEMEDGEAEQGVRSCLGGSCEGTANPFTQLFLCCGIYVPSHCRKRVSVRTHYVPFLLMKMLLHILADLQCK